MRKIGKNIWIVVRSILLFIVISFVLSSTTKNIETSIKINNFKSKGVYQSDISSDTVKYYLVKTNEPLGYTLVNGIVYPGNVSDILVSKEAKIGDPIIRNLIGFFVGGHAAFCTDYYYDYTINKDMSLSNATNIEATGVGSNTNASVDNRYYWCDDTYNEVIGLRVRMTPEEKKEMLSIMCSYYGEPYNYSFIFNTANTSYCSDIISKGFKQLGYNLNKDSFITSIYDLIVTSDTYISYYHYSSNGVKYIYYIG